MEQIVGRYINPYTDYGFKDDRRSVFDVYCENEQGEKIIIEMQKADQQWFKDRSVYQTARENARRMKADGMQAALISMYTALTIEEIDKLL